MGRSQLWAACHSSAFGYKAVWPLIFGKTVRNGMETQHILLRFAGACTHPGPWIQLVALGSRMAGLGDNLVRRDSGMFLSSETSLLAGGLDSNISGNQKAQSFNIWGGKQASELCLSSRQSRSRLHLSSPGLLLHTWILRVTARGHRHDEERHRAVLPDPHHPPIARNSIF